MLLNEMLKFHKKINSAISTIYKFSYNIILFCFTRYIRGDKRCYKREAMTTRTLMKLLLRSKIRSLLSDIRDSGSILSELSRSSNTSRLHNLQHQR